MKHLCVCILLFLLIGCTVEDEGINVPNVADGEDVVEEVLYDRLEPTNDFQIVNRGLLPEIMPVDFNIVLKYGVRPRNVIDTFEGTISKDMIVDDAIMIPYKFTDLQLEDFYNELQSISIEKYPNIFVSPYKLSRIREFGGQEPYIVYDLTYMVNGEAYKVKWDDKYPGKSLEDKMGDDLRSALNNIIDIVEGLEEFRNLPESESGYL